MNTDEVTIYVFWDPYNGISSIALTDMAINGEPSEDVSLDSFSEHIGTFFSVMNGRPYGLYAFTFDAEIGDNGITICSEPKDMDVEQVIEGEDR